MALSIVRYNLKLTHYFTILELLYSNITLDKQFDIGLYLSIL